jgi:hypothetical protein
MREAARWSWPSMRASRVRVLCCPRFSVSSLCTVPARVSESPALHMNCCRHSLFMLPGLLGLSCPGFRVLGVAFFAICMSRRHYSMRQAFSHALYNLNTAYSVISRLGHIVSDRTLRNCQWSHFQACPCRALTPDTAPRRCHEPLSCAASLPLLHLKPPALSA